MTCETGKPARRDEGRARRKTLLNDEKSRSARWEKLALITIKSALNGKTLLIVMMKNQAAQVGTAPTRCNKEKRQDTRDKIASSRYEKTYQHRETINSIT
jgi:hypothetical protein